ncbi:tripeptidyl-peptidase 1-like [Oscarella lobularis]|uniref:tripeptidyl-peptidase 1-like n=1 Tax=Oscarella lobularis TaxID=121494 RepID=UPI0033143846
MLLVRFSLLSALVLAVWTRERIHLEPGQRLHDETSPWKLVRRARADESLDVAFAIKTADATTLENLFWQISTPGSLLYRKHASLEEIGRIVSPKSSSLVEIERWLASEGGVDVETNCTYTINRDFLQCRISCQSLERLFQIELYHFRHPHAPNETIIRSKKLYSVPSNIASHLDFVGGLLRFSPVDDESSTSKISQPTSVQVSASHLRSMYNVSSNVGSNSSNKQAVAQFLKQFFHQTDVKEFFLLFGGSFEHRDKIDKVVGPDTGFAGIEASLDVQYIMSLGANISTWFWSTAGLHEKQEPFLQWIMDVGNTSDVPFVFSVSYGDDEDSLDSSYMNRINQEFMKQGARGISLMFASGDDGTGCNGKSFVPSFPASSPYVTAVGGTEMSDILFGHEVGNIISGGGFSNVFSQPDYQKSAVTDFIGSSVHLPKSSYYNRSGRAYPDVSALSNGFTVVFNLIPTPGVAGTSCAAPTFSGIVSLVNDHLLQEGQSTLGFLNPLLYQNPTALHDITDGCNEGCQETGFCSQKGWDPVTGYGSPNYPTLLEIAKKNYS